MPVVVHWDLVAGRLTAGWNEGEWSVESNGKARSIPGRRAELELRSVGIEVSFLSRAGRESWIRLWLSEV